MPQKRNDALRDGLEWGGGCLKAFANEDDAMEDWREKSSTYPSRIFEMASPNYF